MARSATRKPSGLYRSVILATDFSTGSGMALKRLAMLPLAPNARVTIVHVLPPASPAVSKSLQAFTKEQLAREALELRKRADQDVVVSTHLLQGKATKEIVRHAKETKADLVVMGRHGVSNWKDAFLGSVTERVVLQAETSVLIVGMTPRQPYAKPMAAVDDDPAAKGIIGAAMAIAPTAGTTVVFHAWGLPYESQMSRAGILKDVIKRERTRWEQDIRKHMAELTEAMNSKAAQRVKLALRRGDARYVITSQAASFGADLIVVGSNSRPGFSHLIIGSVAQEVVRGAEKDVLVVRGRTGRRG